MDFLYRLDELHNELSAYRVKDMLSQLAEERIKSRDLEMENVRLRAQIEQLLAAHNRPSSHSSHSSPSSQPDEPVAPLEVFTEDWWAAVCPERLAANTRTHYRFHLKHLKGSSQEDFDRWFDCKAKSYRNQRISLAKKIVRISGLTVSLPDERPASYDINLKPNSAYREDFAEHSVKLFNGEVNAYTLFAHWLPTRRRDIVTLDIRSSVTDCPIVNSYCQATSTFHWVAYKTAGVYGHQALCLDELAEIVPPDAISVVRIFLNSQPEGRLFRQTANVVARKFKELAGLTLQESRHIWVTWVAKRFDQEQQQLLAKWMAHSYECGQSTYKI